MIIIYNLIIRLYILAIYMVSPFHHKASQWVKGRKNIFDQLLRINNEGKPLVWFHVSSLGEFEQGRPVMEEYRRKNPDIKIILTFFSPSGYEIRKNYLGAEYVFYLPADTQTNARRFIEILKPSMAFFVKYDFWYHYINQLNRKNIPLYLISGIFREKQVFFKPYGSWYRQVLRKFTYFFVQDQKSVELLQNIGIKNVMVTGDTRFDRVNAIAQASKEIEVARAFKNNSFCVVCGSTWPPDDEIIARYINQSTKTIKFIIAPHEINETHIENIEKGIRNKLIRFSKANDVDLSQFDVLLIDNIGMLSSLFKYGEVAYIGGGFGKGIHNILEPAAFGLPVIFGPNYKKFKEAHDLISLQGAYSISSFHAFYELMSRFLSEPEFYKNSVKISKSFVESQVGATEKILSKIASINKMA